MSLRSLSDQLAGRVVAELIQASPTSMSLRFDDGAVLVVELLDDRMKVILHSAEPSGTRGRDPSRPTPRQAEYLAFIKKYMSRYGVSPAEADIQEYFMVSAPSVNNMIRTLERRGFIQRARDWSGQTVPRSIRVMWDG